MLIREGTFIRITTVIHIHASFSYNGLGFCCSNMSHIMRKPDLCLCEYQRHRSACASAQSDECFIIRCIDSTISPVSTS